MTATWATRVDLIEWAERHGWTTRRGNRTLLFNHPDGRELVVVWDHVPQLPFTERWCRFVGAEMFIPAADERFSDGMCGTTDYIGSSYSGLDNVRDWLADNRESTLGVHPTDTQPHERNRRK
jgi:hypothetical protein